MKMPAGPIDPMMFAPCGMNCQVCYQHSDHPKPCGGCHSRSLQKPKHCRNCPIRECTVKKDLSYCYECLEYPCKSIKNLEKSYITRYGASLIQNSCFVKEKGLAAFMKQQKAAYPCPACGGILSLQDGRCSDCRWRTDNDL